MEVGTKVYVWDFYEKQVAKSISAPHEEIIGEVIEGTPFNPSEILVKSILDGNIYSPRATHVFEVGTGPGVSNTEIVYEDYYV